MLRYQCDGIVKIKNIPSGHADAAADLRFAGMYCPYPLNKLG
jgi:hypothetical protein